MKKTMIAMMAFLGLMALLTGPKEMSRVSAADGDPSMAVQRYSAPDPNRLGADFNYANRNDKPATVYDGASEVGYRGLAYGISSGIAASYGPNWSQYSYDGHTCALARVVGTDSKGRPILEYKNASFAEIGYLYAADADTIRESFIEGAPVSGSAAYPINKETGELDPGFSSAYVHRSDYTGTPGAPYVIRIGAGDGNELSMNLKAAQAGIAGPVYRSYNGISDEYSGKYYTAPGHIASYSHSGIADWNNPNYDDNSAYWAVFEGCTFTNVHFESHFPLFFKNCRFIDSSVDSRSSNDIVFYGCSFNGGVHSSDYGSDSETRSIVFTSGGKNVMLSHCAIAGEVSDPKVTSFIYTDAANVRMYESTVDASFNKDVISIVSVGMRQGTAEIYSGRYVGNGSNSLIHNYGSSILNIYGGYAGGFDKAVYIEGGGTGSIRYPYDLRDDGNGISQNNYGVYLDASVLTVDNGYIGSNSVDGIHSCGGLVTVNGGRIVQNGRCGIELLNGSGATVTFGTISANGYGIYISDSDLNVSGGLIGPVEGEYAPNGTGIYHDGRLTLSGGGYVAGENVIYLANASKYIVLSDISGEEHPVLGRIDMNRDIANESLGRILYYVSSGGRGADYRERFVLAEEIKAWNSSEYDSANNNFVPELEDGVGRSWHIPVIDEGNGAAEDGGNIISPFDGEHSRYGVLSGWHTADYSESDGINIFLDETMYASGLTAHILDDKVAVRIVKTNTDSETQSFIWRSSYDAICDAEHRPLYTAELYYTDPTDPMYGQKVTYLTHTGWIRATNDGIDRNPDGTPQVYPVDETGSLFGMQTDHNFDWCPVFSVDFDIVFEGNEFEYRNTREGDTVIASGHGTYYNEDMKIDNTDLLPDNAARSDDGESFIIRYTSDLTGMTLPEYCFDLQLFISEGSKGYFDRGKDRYTDHYAEYSQVGWSYSKDAVYDSAELMRKGDRLTDEGIEKLLESLRTSGGLQYSDDRTMLRIYAVLDEAPEMQAKDRYYTSDEISAMDVDEFIADLVTIKDPITGEDILWASDKEDGQYTNTASDGIRVELLNFNQGNKADREREYRQDFKDIADVSRQETADMGGASVTYRVTDGAGNMTYYTAMVYITSSHDQRSRSRWHDTTSDIEGYDPAAKLYVRFIDEWNYKKNPMWNRALSGEGFFYTDEEYKRAYEAYLKGAEQPYSKWYTEPELVRELTEGFRILKTADSYDDYESSYTFSWEDMKNIRDLVASRGAGKTGSQDALKDLFAFMEAHRTTREMDVNNDGLRYKSMQVHAAELRSDPDGVYTMGYPAEWTRLME